MRIQMACTVLLLLCITASCGQRNKKQSSPPGYDLGLPEKMVLAEQLLEVSGIALINGKNDSLYAIQDEEGLLFAMAWGHKKNRQTRFGKKGDYEDLAIANGIVYVLRSDGTVFRFPLESNDETMVTEWKKILPKGEYEGLYADTGTGSLYALCKQCETDKKSNHATGYIITLQADSIPAIQNTFRIDGEAIAAQTGKKQKFHPSALARQPATGNWFILSAVNKMLVVTDRNWHVLQVYPLPGNRFNQPEGIAFDQESNLYISNEGDELTNGNILKFVYNNTGN